MKYTWISLQFKPCFVSFPNTSPAYGATLIEHSLIEAGLPGSAKVDSKVDAAQGIVEQLVKRLLTYGKLQ